jgi:hypothetical protein
MRASITASHLARHASASSLHAVHVAELVGLALFGVFLLIALFRLAHDNG